MDLWVEPSQENARSIVNSCEMVGLIVPPIPAKSLAAPNQIVRIGIEPLRIDLMTSLPGVEFQKCWGQRRMMFIDGLEVPVIDLASLRTTKMASGRLQDLADLERLPDAD